MAFRPRNHEVIASLEAAGYQVKISHRRPHFLDEPDLEQALATDRLTRADVVPLYTTYQMHAELGEQSKAFSPRGGVTTVTILDADGNAVARGETWCHPNESFNRELGTRIALGRAHKQLQPHKQATNRKFE